ncbi:MAG: hypothetical protein J5663_00060 [Bacteroidaceae bacterium]|nr:hypothetical protein [Bacteroidaceae bacterium]
MKKIFTLIATALMAVSVNAQKTEPVVYHFDNKAETYVLGDYTDPTTYEMDKVSGFSVNYTGTSANDHKMQIKLAANEGIFFEYGNKENKKNVLKTAPDYAVFDSKNFVINVPLQTEDVLTIKFSAKGSTASTMGIHGETPCIKLDESTSEDDLKSTAKDDYKVIKFVATKGGTAKVKETTGGFRLYAIAINSDIDGTTTGISEVAAAKSAKVRKAVVNGRLVIETANGTFSATGARVK